MNKTIAFSALFILILFLTEMSTASMFETSAYFQALDQAFHSLGTQKVFIVKPKKCPTQCQKSINSTQKIVQQMNLLRNVPFIIADAFSKNQNLQVRLYDQNGKLSGSIISDSSLSIPIKKIKTLLDDRLLQSQPKTKKMTVQNFQVQQLQGSEQIIKHYETTIKNKRDEKDENYAIINLKALKVENKPQSAKETIINKQQTDKKVAEVSNKQQGTGLNEQQIRRIVSQQVDRQELIQLVKQEIQDDEKITDQISAIKNQFSNLRNQISSKQSQLETLIRQKGSLEKEPSEDKKSQPQSLTKVTDQIKTQEIHDQKLFLKGALILICILACYIFVKGRKNDQRETQFRRVPNVQSLQNI